LPCFLSGLLLSILMPYSYLMDTSADSGCIHQLILPRLLVGD